MRPLSLAERGVQNPAIALSDLLVGDPGKVSGETSVGLAEYVHEILASGFPAIRPLPERLRSAQLDGYIDNMVEREFPDQGMTVRKPESLRAWLRAYAAATGGTASYATIMQAATPGQGDKPSKNATMSYRDTLSELWLTDPVPAWYPVASQFAGLGRTPKHFLADPALAARLWNLTEGDLLRGDSTRVLGPQQGTILGRLFEALAALSLQTYALAAGARLSHLRTSNGRHEVDFIVERGANILAIEVKLAATVDDDDVSHLTWLAHQLRDARLTRVVLTTGPYAYTRRDGIHVLPLALLGP
jgi:predicted AAA+ superfamily ATPase